MLSVHFTSCRFFDRFGRMWDITTFSALHAEQPSQWDSRARRRQHSSAQILRVSIIHCCRRRRMEQSRQRGFIEQQTVMNGGDCTPTLGTGCRTSPITVKGRLWRSVRFSSRSAKPLTIQSTLPFPRRLDCARCGNATLK